MSIRFSIPLLVAALVAAVPAHAAFDVEGKYERIQPAQPTSTDPEKVEVLDVFWYGCPHCWRFLPVMEAYETAKPDFVEIRRMPAIFRETWEPHARAFYTADLLGVADRLHRPIFEAIHEDGERLDDRAEIEAFFVAHGVSEKDFGDTWSSFAVDSLVRKSMVMQGRYGVRGTPSVIVNGKYRVSGSLAGSYENMVKVIQALVEREKRETTASN